MPEGGHAGGKQTLAIGFGKPRRGRVFERESAVADDPRRVRAGVRRRREMQAAHPHVALGGDLERALDRQEAAARRPSSAAASSVSIRRAVSESIDSALVRSRKCDRSDETAITVSGPPQTRRKASATDLRIGVADQDGDDFERRRQHRLEHDQMHFERMLAGERPRIDDHAGRLGELGMRDARDRNLARAACATSAPDEPQRP